jgi:hypothetical protein
MSAVKMDTVADKKPYKLCVHTELDEVPYYKLKAQFELEHYVFLNT